MLLIIADYPNEMNMREGAMQRIDAIDSLIRDRKRVYLNISFKKHLVRSNSSFNNVIVENLNAIIHRNIIKQYMQKSTTIYVHSVYNLLKVITLIDLKKQFLIYMVLYRKNFWQIIKNYLVKYITWWKKRCPWMQKINTSVQKCKNTMKQNME